GILGTHSTAVSAGCPCWAIDQQGLRRHTLRCCLRFLEVVAHTFRVETGMTAFADRVRDVPPLGLGISTEYSAAAAPSALDPLTLRATYPAFAAFLEIGVEVSKGLDETARRWVYEGFPTTYHF